MSASQDDTQNNRVDSIRRLESELQAERSHAAVLREQLEALASKVALLESRTAEPGDLTQARIDRVEARLEEQNQRLSQLASESEESLQQVRRLGQELKLVSGERDTLRNELSRVESLQSETLAIEDSGSRADDDKDTLTGARKIDRPSSESELPSIADLIASGASNEPWRQLADETGQAESVVPASDTGWHELLPADMIVAGSPGESREQIFTGKARWRLVRTDVEPPQEFPLENPLMTIGRSDSADIQIDADFVSRIHARLLQIDASIILEDAGSKNGIRINGERVERWPLTNGDQVQIGRVPFRFVDIQAEG